MAIITELSMNKLWVFPRCIMLRWLGQMNVMTLLALGSDVSGDLQSDMKIVLQMWTQRRVSWRQWVTHNIWIHCVHLWNKVIHCFQNLLVWWIVTDVLDRLTYEPGGTTLEHLVKPLCRTELVWASWARNESDLWKRTCWHHQRRHTIHSQTL